MCDRIQAKAGLRSKFCGFLVTAVNSEKCRVLNTFPDTTDAARTKLRKQPERIFSIAADEINKEFWIDVRHRGPLARQKQ